MSKAVLIMDMPKDCGGCHFCDEQESGFVWCIASEGEMREITNYAMRLADCPLIPAIGYIDAKGNMISWEDDSDELDRNKARRVTQESDDGYFICPSCLRAVDAYANFCSNCGQRLDWEDEE